MIIRITDLDTDLLTYLKQVMGAQWVRLEFLPDEPPDNQHAKAELVARLARFRQWQQAGGNDFIEVDWDVIQANATHRL